MARPDRSETRRRFLVFVVLALLLIVLFVVSVFSLLRTRRLESPRVPIPSPASTPTPADTHPNTYPTRPDTDADTHPPTTPTHPPTPAPASPVDLALALDNFVQSLVPGKIAFEAPVEMKLDETKVVEVRIAKKLNQDLTEGLAKTGGHIEVEDINEVAPTMSATLQGSAFQITPLSKEDQVIAEDNFTAWDWTVHPTDWGNQTLYLAVCVRLQVRNDKEEKRCSPVYQREIAVEVAPMYAATHFIANNMVYTFGLLGSGASALFGGIVWIIRRAKKPKTTVLEP